MNPGQETPLAAAALARRLRDLREKHWQGVRVTQQMLGEAVGGETPVKVPTISGWESPTSTSVPSPERLLTYATIFATRRSLEDGRLRVLPDEELTEDERAARDELHRELLGLRSTASGENVSVAARRSTWHFPDGGPIRLVCGRLKPDYAGAYASGRSPNFTQLHGYADPDALIELFGHVRMINPSSDVRFMLADDMQADDLTAHVVLIGGLEWNRAARFFSHVAGLPVKQVADESIEDGDVFEIERDGRRRRFLPTFLEGDPALGLIEDVGLLARKPNPNFSARTLTLCNGIFSRGVLGAVRTLTDAQLRESNEDYLAKRFAGLPEFGLLLRVPVYGGQTATPDLASEYHRLYAWPREEPA